MLHYLDPSANSPGLIENLSEWKAKWYYMNVELSNKVHVGCFETWLSYREVYVAS